MASPFNSVPSDWRFDASSSSFITDDVTVIRVRALSSPDAAAVSGAQEQVEGLYSALFESTGRPVNRAKRAVAPSFEVPENVDVPSRTVLVFLDTKESVESDRVAAYTRVNYDGERIIIASIAVDLQLPESQQHQALEAIVAATEDIAQAAAKNLIAAQKIGSQPVMVWRGQLGASDFLKSLFQRDGFGTALTDRIEMTAYLKDFHSTDLTSPEGIEIRALSLENEELVKVYDVLKRAFGFRPPSFETWKRHYAQHPRFAPDLTFVAWQDDRPVSVSAIELITDGEGGGEDELSLLDATEESLTEEMMAASFSTPLQYSDDYEIRRQKIRAEAKVGYVCGIATLPELRGKRLAQNLLRHNFNAAARAGLESIYLGTDRQNPAAVRAYQGAGMVETKSGNHGMVTAKLISVSP